MTEARIISIFPEHPGPRERDNGAKSVVHVNIDTGLKSRKLTTVRLNPSEGLRLTAQLALASHQVLEANRQKP